MPAALPHAAAPSLGGLVVPGGQPNAAARGAGETHGGWGIGIASGGSGFEEFPHFFFPPQDLGQ